MNDRPVRRGNDSLGVVLPALACVGLAFFAAPVIGLLTRVPWRDAWAGLTSEFSLSALALSLLVSTSSVVLALLFGFPIAWVLTRAHIPARRLVRAIVLLPMVLPPVVGGVALLAVFGRNGLLGPLLETLGVRLVFTTPAAVLASTFVAAPFMVVALESGLLSLDRHYEEAAASLGAGRWTVIRCVVLPQLAPALGAGIVLTWARALGEFGATIAFAGAVPGRTQTLPLAIYEALQTDPSQAVLLSVLLLAVSLAVLVGMRGRLRP